MRLLLCLAPWMAMTAAWAGGIEKVSVAYSYYPETGRTAIRQDGACWLPSSLAPLIGWSIHLNQGDADVKAEGRNLRVPTRFIDGETYLAMEEVSRQLGAVSWWDGDTYRVAGDLRMLDFSKGNIRADGTLAFKTNIFLVDSPNRLVIDLIGLAIPKDRQFDLPAGVRIGQFLPGTIRLVVEHPNIRMPRTTRPSSSRVLDLNLAPFEFGMPAVPEPAFTQPVPNSNNTATTTTPISAPSGIRTFRIVGDNTLQVTFAEGASASIATAKYIDPTTVQMEFANSVLMENAQFDSSSESIKKISVESLGNNVVRATINTVQPMVFVLNSNANIATLAFRRPKNATGALAGKTIVVDAGHGGSDSGATFSNPRVFEKDVTLAVAKHVANGLSDAGANVIVTRNSDVRVGLKERSAIANRNRADLFVSIHINSNTVDNSRSGTISFHHMQQSDGKLLATCMQSELAKVTDLPSIGVWSDSRIYQSGFSVLRETTMPAVLLELGFINHRTDRAKMVQPGWQFRVAGAIVRGVKLYLGDVKEQKQP